MGYKCAKFKLNKKKSQNFQNFKLEIGFFSKKKNDVTKLENCAHLFIVNYKCAKFKLNKKKSQKKKIVRNFLRKIEIFNFFDFFSEDVLKTLLRRSETFRKKYGAVFEKSPKNMVFLTSKKKASPQGCF